VITRSGTAKRSGPVTFQDVGREQKRQFILEAAATIFGAKGFHAATVRDIAEKAGIAHGTFYLYFRDKKDVYLALSQQFQSRIMEAILPDGEVGALAETADLASIVRERLANLARLFESEEGLARVFVYRSAGTDPEFEERRLEFVSHVTDAIAAVMQAGADQGLFRRQDPRVAAMCLVGSIEMVIECWLQASGKQAGLSLPEMMEEAARFFLPALLPARADAGTAVGSRRALSAPRRKP
jgi:AcrR family transcriptional regulator